MSLLFWTTQPVVMCHGNQQGVWKRTQVIPLKETSLSGWRDGTLLRARVPPLKETSVSVGRDGMLTRACPSPQGDHSVCREGRHIDCGLFVMSSPTPTLLLPEEEKI